MLLRGLATTPQTLFRFVALLLFWVWLLPVLNAQVIYRGMSRDQLIEALGEPTAEMSRGSYEFLTFGDNVRIELRNGLVVSGRGMVVYGSRDEVKAKTPTAVEQVTAPEAVPEQKREPQPPAELEPELPSPGPTSPKPSVPEPTPPEAAPTPIVEVVQPPEKAVAGPPTQSVKAPASAPPVQATESPPPPTPAPEVSQEPATIANGPAPAAPAEPPPSPYPPEYDPYAEDYDWEDAVAQDSFSDGRELGMIGTVAFFFIQALFLMLLFKIAFELSGFPLLVRQLFVLSFTTSLFHVAFEWLIYDAFSLLGMIPFLDRFVTTIATAVLIYCTTDMKNSTQALGMAFAVNLVAVFISWLIIFVLLLLWGGWLL